MGRPEKTRSFRIWYHSAGVIVWCRQLISFASFIGLWSRKTTPSFSKAYGLCEEVISFVSDAVSFSTLPQRFLELRRP
jgi:hypothetical protein